MLVFPSQSGVRRALLAAGAAFLLVAAFPSSAGWRVFFLLVALSVLLWEAWRRRESLGWRNIPRALVIAAAAWIAIDIASLAWSVDPGYTLQEIRRELAYGALAFVVFFSATREPWQMHVWIVTLLAGALLLGLGEWLHVFFPDAWLIRKSSMGPGPFSTHVLMLAPLLVILVWQAPVGMGRSIAFTALAGVALVIAGLAGESRILWVALLVATAVAFATFWTQAPPDPPGTRAARL